MSCLPASLFPSRSLTLFSSSGSKLSANNRRAPIVADMFCLNDRCICVYRKNRRSEGRSHIISSLESCQPSRSDTTHVAKSLLGLGDGSVGYAPPLAVLQRQDWDLATHDVDVSIVGREVEDIINTSTYLH